MENVVLVDVSGSMMEEGKGSVVRYLLHAIEALYTNEYTQTDYKIFMWNDEIVEYNPDTKIVFNGKNNEMTLSEFLKKCYDKSLLFMGDGNYSDKVMKVISECKTERKLALMIGADCNRGKLQRVFGTSKIYDAADVAACISDLTS